MRLGFIGQFICLFVSMSFLHALFNRNVVIYAIKDNRIPSRFYPKHYTKVHHFIKFFSSLNQEKYLNIYMLKHFYPSSIYCYAL